ncbi:MAG: hypothetical protein ABIK22_00415, partial [candidate division WOR-3 bacterium]
AATAVSIFYVAASGSGLRVLSVARPGQPVELGYYDTPGISNGAALLGNLVCIADGNQGMRIIEYLPHGIQELPWEASGRSGTGSSVQTGSSLPENALLADATGRIVRPGSVRSGVYFLLEANPGGERRITRVVLQR